MTPPATGDSRERFEAILRRIAGKRLDPREIDRIIAAADKYRLTARYRDDPKPCGTHAAYRRHLRRGEPVDDLCRAFANTRSSAVRDTQPA